jgi:transposase
MKMTKTTSARYTMEFDQEVVCLVERGQSIAAAAARTLGVVNQTLFNRVKTRQQGKLTEADRNRPRDSALSSRAVASGL